MDINLRTIETLPMQMLLNILLILRLQRLLLTILIIKFHCNEEHIYLVTGEVALGFPEYG